MDRKHEPCNERGCDSGQQGLLWGPRAVAGTQTKCRSGRTPGEGKMKGESELGKEREIGVGWSLEGRERIKLWGVEA